MKVSQCCKHDVVVASPKDDLAHAAKIMRDKHVGFLIVVEGGADRRVPVGVVTDRASSYKSSLVKWSRAAWSSVM